MSERLELNQYQVSDVVRVLERLDATGFQFEGEVWAAGARLKVEYNGTTDNHEIIWIGRE